MNRMDTLEGRPRRLRAPFFSLVLVCLPACQGDDADASDPLPTGEITRIEVTPKAVLLTDDIDSKELRIHAYDAEGREVVADGLDIEWVDADPGDIALVPGDENTASVSAVADVGSGIVVARSRARTDLLSNPVVVRAAVLHPEVVALDDRSILFPPPNHPPGADILDLPGFGLDAGGKIRVGEFELAELLLSLTTSSAEDPQFDDNGTMLGDPAARIRYPVVIARDAYVPGMTRIVGAESSPVAGNVLQAVERGEWVGLMVEAASPVELYDELDIEFDGPALAERGLLDLESLASTSPPAGAGFRSGTPDPWKTYNEGDCIMGDFTPLTKSDLGLNVVPLPQPSRGIWKHSQEHGIEHVMLELGVNVEASIRPEINAQLAGSFTGSCYFTPEQSTTLGLSALTGSVLDARWKFRPRIDMKFEVGAGPRFNAYALFLCTLKATAGFEWKKDQGYIWGDADGQYNTSEVKCNDPEYDASVSAGYKLDDFGGVARSDGGMDGFFHAEVGLVFEHHFSLLLGGVVMDNLIKMVNAGKQTQKVVEEMAERFADAFPLPFLAPPLPQHWKDHLHPDALTMLITSGAESMLSGILSLADIDFLSVEFGPGLKLRLESTQKLLNEADSTTWLADQHQVFGVAWTSKASLGLLDLGKLFKAIFPTTPALHLVPAVTITPPPLNAISFYTGFHPAGSITSVATKGPNNEGEDFEVHDRLKVRVPGAFPWTAIDLSGASKYPTGGWIFIRNSLTDGGKLGVRALGELKYVGTEGDLLIFEGEFTVEDNEIRDHLVARKELYFVGYNEMFGFSVPGYLNSYTGYDITPPQVDVEVKPPVLVESTTVSKSVAPVVKLINKSRKGDTPIDATVEIGAVPAWITPPASPAPLAAGGELDLTFSLQCESVGPKNAIIPLTIRHVVEKEMMAPQIHEKAAQIEVQLNCTKASMPGDPTEPPAFVGTECPAVGNEVDYDALDAELELYQNKHELQFGLKLLPALGNECKPSYYFELPVPCGKYVDYQLWKMGGSTSENDLGFGTAYFIWNPHYYAHGMWQEYGLEGMTPVTLLSYAQETSPLAPCNDARMDPVSGPTSPIIEGSEHKNMIRAFSLYTRAEPDASWPEGYQECFDRVEIKAGNLEQIGCSEGTTSGALYLVVQPKLVVGSH